MAETTNYLILGLVGGMGILSIYALSLLFRLRQTRDDIETIQKFTDE